MSKDASQGMLVPAGGASGSRSFPQGHRQLVASQSLTQLPMGVPPANVPDPCYQQLTGVAAGPGAAHEWPLGHDARYTCRLDDMRLVAKLWDAYEVGFRGRKRARPTTEELIYG